MEDFINSMSDRALREELLRLWRLYPSMPIPFLVGATLLWEDLQIDLSKFFYSKPFLYFVDDEPSEELFHQRLEQFK